MSLSRPIFSLLTSYLEQLFNHPVRTKSIIASILAASANATSQCIAGSKKLNQNSLFSYALFGFIFGGSIPHYFNQTVESLFDHDIRFRRFLLFLSERLAFTPFYQALSLYFLSIFESNSHSFAMQNLEKLYWPLLCTNWQYLSLFVYLNFAYVPSMLRTIMMALLSYFWITYIALKRRRFQEQQSAAKKKTN